MGVCLYTLDKMITQHFNLDTTSATATNRETPVLEVELCSTIRIDVVYLHDSDVALDVDVLVGNLEDGSDLAAIDYSEVDPQDVQILLDEDGVPEVTQPVKRLKTLEFCPSMGYFKVELPQGAGRTVLLVSQANCRNNPPQDLAKPGHNAYRI